MSSPIRAIFFDAGNTLLFPRLEELAQDLTGQGFPATVEDFFEAERRGKKELDAWLWPQIRSGQVPRTVDHVYWAEYRRVLMERVGVPEEARERLAQRVGEAFRDIRLWSRVLPDTAAHLDSLRARGYFLGVISNSVGTIEEQLHRAALGHLFQVILDSALVGVEKPHPEIFRKALSHAGASPSEALFVGDTYSVDIGGAQLVGLRGVLMDRVGAYPDAECPRITSLSEIARIVDSMGGK